MATGTITRLSPAEVSASIASGAGVQIVDVRTPLEFDGEHIEPSKNIPLDELSSRGSELNKDSTIILVCRSGMRASRAADLLASYGMEIGILDGGVVGWKRAGLTLKEGKKRMPLERQVQLTIGTILLSSVAAGWTLNKGWFIVPAFIGAGLTFAGLTGNCGLAMLLAKAPWNKLENCETSSKKNSCCS
jgi:rhodanese-related sulfurtransferase